MDENLCDTRFAAIAQRTPQAPAVLDGGRLYRYADIDERSGRISRWLTARGAGPEQIVAILVGRGADLPTCTLGVWKAGAAYLALDDETPRDRLRSILGGCRPAAVLTQRHLRHRLPPTGAPVLSVDDPPPQLPPGAPPDAARRSPGQLAYVIHTSGSTGAPKRVGVSHRSLLAILDDWRRVYRLGSEVTSVLQAAGFGFDVATGDLVRGLLTGSCLITCPRETLLSPPELYLLLQQSRASFAELTPSLLRPLVSHLRATGQRLDHLRCLVTGGERWSRSDYIGTRDVACRSLRIFNTYGLTETAIDNSYYELSAAALDHDVVPVGRPFADSELFVLDGDLREAAEGEVFIGGPQLARGYLGDPVTTALQFVPAPDGPPGARLYRTGDLARRLPGGDLLFLRRADSQLRIRGVRVDPLEVESTLASHPAVAQAVVVPHEHDGRTELAAYVVPAADISLSALRRFLASRLPTAMVPAFVTALDKIPVNQSGKADLSRLPPPGSASEEPSSGPGGGARPEAGPSTQVEAALLRIWSRTLGRTVSRADQDFFELGGTSLLATQVTVQVQAELGADLPSGTIYQHPTVAELAPIVARATAADRIPADPQRTTGPLSPAQNRLWILHQLGDELVAYNIPAIVKITGSLDSRTLREALNRLLARHAALRTAFTAAGDGPVQRVTGCRHVPFTERAAGTEAAARAFAEEFARRPFDLTRPPLLRAALLHGPEQVHWLMLSMHHIASDGWTVRILLDELGELYSARLAGRWPDLPPQAVSFLDVAAWQAGRLRQGDFDEQLASWLARLDNVKGERMLPAAPVAGGGPRRRRAGLGLELTSGVRDLAREYRTTLFVPLLAAFAALLQRWSGQRDLVIGVPLGDRPTPGTQRLAGFFVNTAALRLQLPAEPTFADLIGLTREAVMHAIAHQDVPFDVVLARLGRSGTAPLFQTWFNFLGPPDPTPVMTGLRTEIVEPPVPGAVFDLNLYITEQPDELQLELVYDSARCDGPHMAAFIEQYLTLLRQVTAEPEVPVGDHPRPAGPVPPAAAARGRLPSLPTLVAEQVRRRPCAIAVRSAAGDLTYQRLGAWAAAVAGQLEADGVGPGSLVAVYAPRSADLVAALLGILESGSAFCVLNPAYPLGWLTAQLAAARPDALLHAQTAGPLPTAVQTAAPVIELNRHPDVTVEMAHPPAAGLAGRPAGGPGYVAFTSGTSGAPKAVRGGQDAIVHFLRCYADTFALGPDDRFAMLSGLAHDPLLRDVFAPLSVGASVCVPPGELIRTPGELRGWLAETEVTVAHLTPPMARLLSGARGPGLPRLRLVMSGGDMLYGGDVEGLRVLAPDATVVNAYGTTETPQVMSWEVIGPRTQAGPPGIAIGIGRAIDGVQLLIRAAGGRRSAVGELGHVIVRTPYLTEGLGPEYDTGDLGRLRPDGRIDLAGRDDGQLKIDGFRVELSALDGSLRRLPYLRDCLTVRQSGVDGRPCLVSYVVPADGRAPSLARVRADLRAELPPYLLPSGLVALDRLPLTPNGKLDRAALPPWTPASAGERPVPPGSALEQAIADIWRRALGGAPVSAYSSFFDVGGSSMLMIWVQERLQAELGLQVPVLTLFEYPTVRALAAHLAAPRSDAPKPRALEPGGREPGGREPGGPGRAPRRGQNYSDSVRRLGIRRELLEKERS